MAKLSAKITRQIDDAVNAYIAKRHDFEIDALNLQSRLLANPELRKLIHSMKVRAKDPAHLKEKLVRKANLATANSSEFTINDESVFDEISDLAGVRLLHLHMRQIEKIHPMLVKTLADEGYVMHVEPEAKTWDLEYEKMFAAMNIQVSRNESLYTSVHYSIRQNLSTRRLCELQVRTLAEEIWGEVSHTINYPSETDSVACKEQLKALARFVSGCSRLVDSIFATYQEHTR